MHGAIVVDHKDDRPSSGQGQCRRCLANCRWTCGWQPNCERRPYPGGAFGGHVAAKHMGEMPCDRETEASATVIARCRCLGLAESLEEPGHLLRCHTDSGIGDAEFQPNAVGPNLAIHDKRDPTTRSELRCIT